MSELISLECFFGGIPLLPFWSRNKILVSAGHEDIVVMAEPTNK